MPVGEPSVNSRRQLDLGIWSSERGLDMEYKLNFISVEMVFDLFGSYEKL